MNNIVEDETSAILFLPLSEAAVKLAQETGEQVTSDWLLQFASNGKLKISFITRTVIPLKGGELDGTSIIYNIGEYINLPPEYARWMHGSKEKPRTVELSLLPTPHGARYIKDALTGKRIKIKVHEEDLFVSTEEITSMVSTLLERRGKTNKKSKVIQLQPDDTIDESITESLPYKSLCKLFENYLETPKDELPEGLKKILSNANLLIFTLWDELSPKERKNALEKIDSNHDPAHEVKRTAGRLIAFMDAETWWLAESITPQNAAMLLCMRNPNTQKVESAEKNTNDEMGPDDFRRLKNVFEGAKDKQKTLKEWISYARQRSIKIHSWIKNWEEWVQEVGAKAIEQSLAQPEMPLESPAMLRAQVDITRQRGTRRRIIEQWDDIEKEYGPQADSRQVLRVLKRDKDEKKIQLKTVQNHLSILKNEGFIP